MPVSIPPFTDVPAPNDPIASAWAQHLTQFAVDQISAGPTAPTNPEAELWYDTADNGSALSLPTPWTGVTFQNSWTNFGSGYQDAQYRKVGDIVYLRGWVKGGAAAVTMFQLPVGFRPPAYVHMGGAEANDKFGVMRCDPSGNVALWIGDPANHVSINNLFFSSVA